MQTNYNRSEILSFHELTEAQKSDVLDTYFTEVSEAEETEYVIFKSKKPGYDAALPLCMFMSTNKPNIWDGVYGTSYFSAYFVKLSFCGTAAVVAERFI